ncbi:LCP family protein [Dietzia sp. 179-F 9C3 NHS]|uniref:LCP family protein n=1 Tax=Dietzia sp. 179-F 9C3 NHS TaxID=3374295 RepID=UPI00387A30A1
MSAEQPVTGRRTSTPRRGRRRVATGHPTASRAARTVASLASAACLAVTGVGWSLVSGLNSDLSSAGGLEVGSGVLDGAVDILVVGTDNRTDAQGNPLTPEEVSVLRAGDDEEGENTDTILLIRVPKDGSSATAISIPRDTYVRTRDIGQSKINGVYSGTKDKYLESAVADGSELTEQDHRDGVQAGRNGLINAVKDLTGVEVDHYAEIGLLGFVLLTDAVGGVPVCLNNDVYEPLSGADFHAGVQTVSGADALSFVRQRHDLPAGDLDRIVRQQAFMSQLVKEILSAGTLADPSKLGKLSDAAKRSFVIDENWDFVDFAMKLKDISGGAVRFETIPVTSIDSVSEYGESIVTVDPEQVQEFVSGFASGDSDDAAGDGDAGTVPETLDPEADPDLSAISVQVVNTTAIDGLAAQVSGALTELGYGAGDLLSDPGAAYTSYVAASSSTDPAAFGVADALGGLPVQVDSAVPPGSVRVVLAEDYSGPTAPAAPAEESSVLTTTYAPLPPSIAQRPTFDAGGIDVPCVN